MIFDREGLMTSQPCCTIAELMSVLITFVQAAWWHGKGDSSSIQHAIQYARLTSGSQGRHEEGPDLL